MDNKPSTGSVVLDCQSFNFTTWAVLTVSVNWFSVGYETVASAASVEVVYERWVHQ